MVHGWAVEKSGCRRLRGRIKMNETLKVCCCCVAMHSKKPHIDPKGLDVAWTQYLQWHRNIAWSSTTQRPHQSTSIRAALKGLTTKARRPFATAPILRLWCRLCLGVSQFSGEAIWEAKVVRFDVMLWSVATLDYSNVQGSSVRKTKEQSLPRQEKCLGTSSQPEGSPLYKHPVLFSICPSVSFHYLHFTLRSYFLCFYYGFEWFILWVWRYQTTHQPISHRSIIPSHPPTHQSSIYSSILQIITPTTQSFHHPFIVHLFIPSKSESA